jgi:hypothetical protein
MIGNRVVPALGFASAAFMIPKTLEARPALNPQHEVLIGRCIREAASGRAWLERTLWGLRDQEAGWIGAKVRNSNGTHDLGPMQINTWWLPKISALTGRTPETVKAWLIGDACFNVQTARWIFLTELRANRNYWKAIGAYHSPTNWRQRNYALDVSRKVKNRFGED